MTRKKSKVKALALAVTCAILAGGYSGVGTVYVASAASNNVHDGDTTINGKLTLTNPTSGSQGNNEYLDFERLGMINLLVKYSNSTAQNIVITAGDGSTIGGVGFNAGVLTGVKSINADDEYAKFRVAPKVIKGTGEESKAYYIFRAGNLEIATDINAEGSLYKDITFTDTNSRSNTVTLAEIVATSNRTQKVAIGSKSYGNVKDTFTSLGDKLKVYDKHSVYDNSTSNWSDTSLDLVTINEGKQNQVSIDTVDGIVISHQGHDDSEKTAAMNEKGVFAGGKNYDNAKAGMSNADGSLKAADGKFKVNADGAIKAADNNFIVDDKGAITAAGSKFYVKEDGKVQIEDELVISHAGSGTEADPGKSATLNIDKLTSINKLMQVTGGVDSKVVYDTSGNPVITAGDGSTIGGVTISGGQLSVSYSGAPDGTARVNVSDLWKDHELVNNDEVYSNKKLKDSINTVESIANAASTQTAGIHRISKAFDGTDKKGTSIENTLDVYENGTVIINENSAQQVTIDSNGIKVGKLVSASGSKIGDVTIDGESLSNGTKSIKVSELASDHALVNDADKGNEKLYREINLVKGFANGIDDRTGGITNSYDPNDPNKTATIIEGVLKVDNDGTATITEGFKAGEDGKNSLTITGLKTTEIRAGNNNTEFFVDGGGNVVADGTLSAAGGKFDVSSEGNITASGSLSVAGDKFRVNTDGSINANNKFNIDTDGALRAANDKFTADKDGNVRASGSLSAAGDKFYVGTDGSINVNQKFIVDADGTISSEGTLSVAGGKFIVNADGNIVSNGTLSVAGNKFSVDENGAFSAAGGNFKVDADGLITAGSMKMDNIEAADTNKGVTVGGVNLKNNNIKATGGKFNEIIVNENTASQVRIDSNGIKVGNNSAFVSEDGFKTSGYLYVGTKTSPTEDATDARFYVNGSDGSFKAADGAFQVDGDGDVVAKGSMKSKNLAAGTNGDEFVVDENGNLVSKGTLSAANGAFSVGIGGDVITSGSVKLNSGANSTQLTAGGVSFTKDGKTTTIEGDKVTVSSSSGSKSFNLSDIADVGQNMTGLSNRVSDVENSITNVKQDVTNLGNSVGNLNDLDSDLKARDEYTGNSSVVGAINAEAAARKEDVNRLDGRIDGVETSITDVKNSVDSVKQDVTSLGTRIDGVETSINDVKNSVAQINTDFSQVSGRIDTVSNNLGDLNALDSDLTAREEYTTNSSVVGGINAEAAVRKEEVTRLDTAIADEAAARQADVARLDGRISDVSSRVNKVGAMAAAISSLKTMGYDPESPTEFSVGLGQYKGETGVALGFFHYPNKNFMINVSLSTSSGEIMGGIGATWRFGHKSPQKLLEEQREAQVKKEIAAAEAYKAARAAKQTK